MLGDKKEFSFYEKPDIHITNMDLQRMIREIYIKLDLEKSFEIINLNESLITEQKKIQELEQTIFKLRESIK